MTEGEKILVLRVRVWPEPRCRFLKVNRRNVGGIYSHPGKSSPLTAFCIPFSWQWCTRTTRAHQFQVLCIPIRGVKQARQRVIPRRMRRNHEGCRSGPSRGSHALNLHPAGATVHAAFTSRTAISRNLLTLLLFVSLAESNPDAYFNSDSTVKLLKNC